jgi:exonuclease V gamma subunit
LKEIKLDDFVKFFEAPIDWYFEKVLGIKYKNDTDETLPDTELFDLNTLDEWKVKSKLLTNDLEKNEFINKGIKQGSLPLKNLAQICVDELEQKITAVSTTYRGLTQDRDESSLAVDITINNVRIYGTLDGIFENNFISYGFSNNRKYKIRAYIRSLLFFTCNNNHNATTTFIRHNGQIVRFPRPVDCTVLEELVEYVKKGRKSPLIFTLNAATNGQNPVTVNSVREAIKKEAFPTWVGTPCNNYLRVLWEQEYFEKIITQDTVNEILALSALLN